MHFFCTGKKLGYYVFQHNLVFAFLQNLRRVHTNFADVQMLAWLPVAMTSSCSWPMSRRAEAIAAGSARVMVFVAPEPLGLIE